MPQRIQRRRVAGWRLPADTVIVDRTSRFGNPFTVAEAITANYSDPQRACVSHFAAWFDDDGTNYPHVFLVGKKTFDRRWMRANLHLLRGKNLCCPCKEGEPCHADWLIERVAEEFGTAAFYACPKPSTVPGHDVPHSEPGDCELHEIPLIPVDENGHEVAA